VFNFIKQSLTKLYQAISSPLQKLFNNNTIDEATLAELENILIQADTGVRTTEAIIKKLKSSNLATGAELKAALQRELISLLNTKPYSSTGPIYLLVGINGSGKTTLASKLAFLQKQQGKKVLLVAADTFRAAAQEQLTAWGKRLDIPVVMGAANSDPSAVIFQACQQYKQGDYDCMIIDTAGRLQTKINLMKELEKIGRVISKQLPDTSVTTLLTVDSMLGQNSLEQAKLFHESTPLDGIALTKMDGTGKGGIVFSIVSTLGIPIAFISYGEKPEQLKLFSAQEYVELLLS
jgi:fused signal recognition particle receptor